MTKKIIDALSAVSVAIFLGIASGRVRFLVEARVCCVCFCALLFLAQHPVHAAASLIGPLLISNQATRGRNKPVPKRPPTEAGLARGQPLYRSPRNESRGRIRFERP